MSQSAASLIDVHVYDLNNQSNMPHKDHQANYMNTQCLPVRTTKMASALRQIFDRCFVYSSGRKQSSCRRSLSSNVNQEEFPCYSVCVARLAIMVRKKQISRIKSLKTYFNIYSIDLSQYKRSFAFVNV